MNKFPHQYIKQLQAKNKQMQNEIDALRERELVGGCVDDYFDQSQIISDLRQENAILRKALQGIIDHQELIGGAMAKISTVRMIAIRALANVSSAATNFGSVSQEAGK